MATAFKIIKNAPPVSQHGNARYPFAQLEVGDAFDVPAARRNTVAAAASQFSDRHGLRFTTRKLDKRTVRVWRVA